MCNIKRGDLPVSVTWSLQGEVVSSDPSLTTSMIGPQISLLNIANVDYQHSGLYTCRATNLAGSVTHSAQLRVNGKLEHGGWKYFNYRETGHCSILLWQSSREPGRVRTAALCGVSRRPASVHHLESEGRHRVLGPRPLDHHDWSADQSTEYFLGRLSALWSLHLQGRECCGNINLLCRAVS